MYMYVACAYYCWKFTIVLPRELVSREQLSSSFCRLMSPLSLYFIASLNSSLLSGQSSLCGPFDHPRNNSKVNLNYRSTE